MNLVPSLHNLTVLIPIGISHHLPIASPPRPAHHSIVSTVLSLLSCGPPAASSFVPPICVSIHLALLQILLCFELTDL
eukprot:768716-Hanusia_phi.AAC.1